MKIVLLLGLVAFASAAKMVVHTDSAEELAGTFKAKDGTVMHFTSVPGELSLHDAQMNEIWNSEYSAKEEPALLESKEVQQMISALEGSAFAKNAGEFSQKLGQTHPGHKSPLAMQFHTQMMGLNKMKAKVEDEDEEEEEIKETNLSQYGRRRRRRRYKPCNNSDQDCRGRCGNGSNCWSWVCGTCGCHNGCRNHDDGCCNHGTWHCIHSVPSYMSASGACGTCTTGDSCTDGTSV